MKQPITTPDLPERVGFSWSQLFDTGVLWYINATCFHPHGLALAVENDDASAWSLHATDGEPIVFEDGDFIRARFAAAQALFAEARERGCAPDGAIPAFRKAES